ncbi:uncharacterized protein LOC111061010 isoform X2 [Nilaparvata lugens]|uniref:uncharacterized protein LOC111061010 isoform X2 n=1 Tax=Nilaparvata lugens TaxID=108931 RepID=UPI00193DBBCD|nr:uncharacterized protein LOC111061010 isoform X2 [Nilaparvata lugens]
MALSLSHARERDPLKAMEQATSRNYSDFMRSLAAKYNHTNPNDYFSGARRQARVPVLSRTAATVTPVKQPVQLHRYAPTPCSQTAAILPWLPCKR